MSKKKRKKNPPSALELIKKIKDKYFDGKLPSDDKQRSAVHFLFDTYSYNLNKTK